MNKDSHGFRIPKRHNFEQCGWTKQNNKAEKHLPIYLQHVAKNSSESVVNWWSSRSDRWIESSNNNSSRCCIGGIQRRCSLLLMSTRRQTGCTYTLHCSGIKYWCTHFLNASPGSAVPPLPPRNSRWREASDFRICSLRLLCTAHEKSLCIMWWVCIVCQLVCVFEDKVNIIIQKDRSFLRRMCV